VTAVTGTGGAAAMVVDRLGVLGADVVAPSAQVIANLAARDIPVAPVPLTDIPMVQGSGARYTAVLSELLASEESDAVVAVIGSSSQSSQVITDRIIKAGPRGGKPLAVFLAPRADDGLRFLEDNGVAAFRTPESCADSVNAYLNWRAPAAPVAPPPAVLAAVERAVAALAAGPSGSDSISLNERDSCAIFSALGIAVADSVVMRDPATLGGGPGSFALKILSPDILHKTDAGLVRLGVPAAMVRGETERLLRDAQAAKPAARIDGVLVQRMESGLAEVIVGFRRDPEVGPVVVLGAGGVAAELKQSRAVRIAPVDVDEAQQMIDEVRELALLRGYRNLPRGDCAALAAAISAMSFLGALRTVLEAEINPLIVKREGRGVVAVDGLVILAGRDEG
jgi:acyl-CoA synthetase (NDP forming)